LEVLSCGGLLDRVMRSSRHRHFLSPDGSEELLRFHGLLTRSHAARPVSELFVSARRCLDSTMERRKGRAYKLNVLLLVIIAIAPASLANRMKQSS
jgi:hypothetical protein